MSQLKVELRAADMLAAGKWATRSRVFRTLDPSFQSFFEGLAARGRRKGAAVRKVTFERQLAEQITRAGLVTMGQKGPPRNADPGFNEFLKILYAISAAVFTANGRPPSIDPIEAFAMNEEEKAKRGPRSRAKSTSVERVAKRLKTTSRSVDAALAMARPVVEIMRSETRKPPPKEPNR